MRLPLTAALVLALACPARHPASLTDLCAGIPATVTVDATIDSVRPPAGPALTGAKGQHFTMRFTFAAPGGPNSPAATAGSCDGQIGSAAVDADLPAPLRNAASASHQASWRIDGETMMLDLNPGTRDNNIFVALPVRGGDGHWGLSTFAGEVASGPTRVVP